jgi:type IV pilus assembly protein PilN
MIRVNLLPHSDAKAARRRSGGGPVFDKMKVVPLAALSTVMTASLVVLMLQSAREKSLEQEVAVARAEAEKYKKTIALIDEMVRKENELNRRLDIVRQLDQNRFRTVTVLDEMAKRVPNYLWLTSVKEVSGNKLAIDGLAFSNLVISDLMSNLEGSNVFRDVDLTVAKRKEVETQSVVGFTLTTAVAVAGPAAKSTDAAPSAEGASSASTSTPAAAVAEASAEVKAAQPASDASAEPAESKPAASTPAPVEGSAGAPAPTIQIPAAPPAGVVTDESPSGAGASAPAPSASSETPGG